jgi:predicted GNAT family acetyltransferase
MTDVSDNPASHRFELAIDGHVATSHYELKNGVIAFMHTEVPEALGGRGIGSQLIRGALDQVRTRGLKVVALCPFVKGFIDKHPDYAAC